MLSHTYRFASTHLGFSLGYLRWYSMALLVPFEITNAMAALSLWEPGALVAVRVGIVAAIILGFNMLPETIFKRMETFFTGVKLVTAIGLILLSTILAARGIPGTPVRGFYYWRHPGAMNQYLTPGHLGRFLGLVQCVLYSTISFIFSPELTVVRAEKADGETGSSVLKVAQIDNIHLCALYILSALAMGVPKLGMLPRYSRIATDGVSHMYQ
ncbi:hypothetical protein EYZ11_012314 [Aspergillus tanneri]|uniref:Amino acid permease/ SLC12A domain-containing protein n=1 Tax=Aspergillus tanneri TaxID=1220188 RepID=A0A4S3J0K4_9EURO|nr:hypothetical protein EYZ11_012314 [Aspergillus tanneri]